MQGALTARCEAQMPTQMSLTSKLKTQKEDLIKRLEQVNNVIDLLEKNPETQTILDAITKLGVY